MGEFTRNVPETFGLFAARRLTPSQPSLHEISTTPRWTTRGPRLTAGSVPVVAEVLLLEATAHARLVPHEADLRHAEARVGLEEEAAVVDGQVVLLPVPQVLQLLVVERGEGIGTARH